MPGQLVEFNVGFSVAAHVEENSDDGEAVWLGHGNRESVVLGVPVDEVQLKTIPQLSMKHVQFYGHFILAHLGRVQLPLDGVLRPFGPRGTAPVRVKLDQTVGVFS